MRSAEYTPPSKLVAEHAQHPKSAVLTASFSQGLLGDVITNYWHATGSTATVHAGATLTYYTPVLTDAMTSLQTPGRETSSKMAALKREHEEDHWVGAEGQVASPEAAFGTRDQWQVLIFLFGRDTSILKEKCIEQWFQSQPPQRV